jgi:hypothetical protein
MHLPPIHWCRKSALFLAMRLLGDAPTQEQFDLRLQQLQPSDLYSDTVQQYLETEWLPCVERWAACHRTVRRTVGAHRRGIERCQM